MVRHNPDGSITIGRERDLIKQTERTKTVGTEQTVPAAKTAESAADKPKKRGRAKK